MNKKIYNIIANEHIPTMTRDFDERITAITDEIFREALDEFPDTYEIWDEIDSSNPEWEAWYLRWVEHATETIKFMLTKDSLTDS